MIVDPVSAIAVIAVVAVVAQVASDRLELPSVIFLLGAGMALTPWLDPDDVFGDLLFSGVGLGVAILLFEGGAGLNWSRIGVARAPVVRLVTIGAMVTWAIGAGAAWLLLDIDADLAVLIGAILIVSGPTVIIPILALVRPRRTVGDVARWEGILIDPIGAALAIVVLDAIIEDRGPGRAALRIATTFGVGMALGVAVGLVLVEALRRDVISDELQISATLAAVVGVYAAANELRPEAGLVAATALGMTFANQRRAPSSHIVEFNARLGATILGVLFVVLGARVEIGDLVDHLPASLAIVAVLVIVGRPLAVLASTAGTGLTSRDRAFLMSLAPRGVVAVAVASIFATELDHHDIDPGPLVPVVFTVVLVTVTVAGIGAKWASRKLRVAQPTPIGVALIGGGPFAVAFARQLAAFDIPTIHVGLEPEHEREALDAGQLVFQGRLDTEEFVETVEAMGIGQAVALSGTDHLDTFALLRFADVIGSENLYGLHEPTRDDADAPSRAFSPTAVLPDRYTPSRLQTLMAHGVGVRTVRAPRHPHSGWLTICAVVDGAVHFVSDPQAVEDGTFLVQVGPGLSVD